MDITNIVIKMTRFNGINDKVSSHSIRSGGAFAALESGFSIETIRILGGWASANTTLNCYLRPSYSGKIGFTQILNSKKPNLNSK